MGSSSSTTSTKEKTGKTPTTGATTATKALQDPKPWPIAYKKKKAEESWVLYVKSQTPALENIVDDYGKWSKYASALENWAFNNGIKAKDGRHYMRHQIEFLAALGKLHKLWKENGKQTNERGPVVEQMNNIFLRFISGNKVIGITFNESFGDYSAKAAMLRDRGVADTIADSKKRYDEDRIRRTKWTRKFEHDARFAENIVHLGGFGECYAHVMKEVEPALLTVGHKFVDSAEYKYWFNKNEDAMKAWHSKGKEEWLKQHYPDLYKKESTAKIAYVDYLGEDGYYASQTSHSNAFLYPDYGNYGNDNFGRNQQLLSGYTGTNGSVVLAVCLAFVFCILCCIIGAVCGAFVAVRFTKGRDLRIKRENEDEMVCV